ncbi:peptidase MA family metallohydrolase [Planococcus sp. X10-3]|uniref:peptidase MA family metallohydrolase n=1 Tax=Planococcus sp. X10-3 TaxID=3061240 RepID=UPI003BAEED8E
MKKSKKILLSVGALIISIILLLLLGGSFIVYKIGVEPLDTDLTYIQAMNGFITGNADGEGEKQLKESSMREDHRHISIYYEENFSELLPLTKETLDLAIERNGELFGETDNIPFDLLVYENFVEMNGFKLLGAKDAYYSNFQKVIAIHNSGKELLLAEDELALYGFQQILLHEYNHYAFYRRVSNPSHYPTWFIEGVAEYASNDPEQVYYPHFETIPFAQLNSIGQWEAAFSASLASPYMQSYYALEFLTAEHGEEVITQIIDSVDETRNFEESFEEVTGLTLQELESAFLSSYKD